MEEYFTAFQTVLRDRHNDSRFIVKTYDTDGYGNWFTRVYQCDPNGDYDWRGGIDREYHGQCSAERALQFHLDCIKEYSPIL